MKKINISKQRRVSSIPYKRVVDGYEYTGEKDTTLLADLISNANYPLDENGIYIIQSGDHWLHGYAYSLVEIL